MGQSSSKSVSNITNTTSTFTSTIADSFNNALNTTQNFSGLGATSGSAGGDILPSVTSSGGVSSGLMIGAAVLLAGLFFIFKRK